jgi:hypothetical protein
VCGLSQNTAALEEQAELPGGASLLALRLVNDNSVQQAAATDSGDKGRVECRDLRAEDLAELHGTISELLIDQDVEGGHGDRAAKRVSGNSISSQGLGGYDR